ncbi:MAG: transposase [Candidatus Desulforudis sp.]|nr:transposase [Desulforudis sp.]
MPRRPRIHIDNGFYHVLARGNNKAEVFHHPDDYRSYLSILDTFGQKLGVLLHAYVLMPNHVHLVVQVGTLPLSKFMQRVQQTYTQAFNQRHSRVGHVFQGRFKAFLVEDDSYLLALIRYIHLNPVRAGITVDPEDYPWTSHHHYTKGSGPGRVHTAFVLEFLASWGVNSLRELDLLPGTPAGPDAANRPELPAAVPPDNTLIASQFTAILGAVARATAVKPASITGSGRDRATCRARHLLIYYAIHKADFGLSTISKLLNCSLAAVSLAADKVHSKLDTGNREWQGLLTAVETHLLS